MTRFAFCDHVYNEAWASLTHSTMEEWFQQCFGTSNFWELALDGAGNESKTFVWNWYSDYPASQELMLRDVAGFEPDVVVSMEVGRFQYAQLRQRFPNAKLIAFCSHRADALNLRNWDVIFSSFPWMPEHCKEVLGVRCEYLPLAFGCPTLRRIGEDSIERDIDVAFVGGIGYGIWDKATEVLTDIAEAIPEFQWWGYTAGHHFERLPAALRQSYKGEAWGVDYFRLLHRIKILVNRHGEIANGFGNNARQYEALGCGCRLLTDNLGEVEHSWGYTDAPSAINAIKFILSDWERQSEQARDGQRWALANCCYENRLPRFLEVIDSL